MQIIQQPKEVKLASEVPLGICKIRWRDGVMCAGLIGAYHSGQRFIILSNWTSDSEKNPCGLLSNFMDDIESLEFIDVGA